MFIKVSVSKSQPIKVPLNVHCKVYCYTGLSWLLGYCLVTTHVLSSPVTTHSLLNLHTHAGQFRISNVSPTEDKKASKVKVKVRLDILGVIFVRECAIFSKVCVSKSQKVKGLLLHKNMLY